jgi:hypothetical protein
MARGIRPLGAASQAALAAIAVGALLALAACGSAVAEGHSGSAGGPVAAPVPGGEASAGVALCEDIPKLTSVEVSRTMTLREFQPGLVLPPSGTVKEPRLVRGLAAALCGLPKAPRMPVNCPAQFLGLLRLAFAAGQRPFLPVTVQVSGCRVVTGLGTARTASAPTFWRALGNDLGLQVPRSTGQSGGINP